MKKKRLIVCTGYYHLINIITVLQQRNGVSEDFENILILWINSQDSKKLSDFALSFNIFSSIHLAFLQEKDDGFFKVKKELPHKFYDEIISPFYYVYTQRLANYKINCNSLIVVDEGTETYVDTDRLPYEKKINKTLDVYLLNKSLLSCFTNVDSVKLHSIDINTYKNTLSKIEENLILKENSVIFLSSTTWVSKDKNGYNNEDITIINKLISLGYNVYYKAHPRNYLKQVNKLANIIKSDKFSIIDTKENILIETILFKNKDKIKFILGDSSSTLFQSYQNFGIPAFSLLKNKYSLYQLKMFRYLPDFEEFLELDLTPKEFYVASVYYLNTTGKKFDTLYNQILVSRIVKRKKRKKIINISIFLLVFVIALVLLEVLFL
ncbi:MAG: alpha-2,8-polysialyltransferase family protein [Alphaproteobacteria bacterium]|jgi:hypothetical protein|nr:alpha-2,8-polysialyltransferase family protein [Alphaproteobacteria bacterium]